MTTNNMQSAILAHLEDIERKYDVRVLLAVESGSRARGLYSDESDWDLRFVYVNKLDWYLNVNEGRDVIEEMYDDNIDMVGWELRKTLRLFQKSNPSLMEWLHSPVIYRADEDFLSRMRALEPLYFNPIKTMYHYESLYIKHDKRYLQDSTNPLKRFLHYLRGILSCRWLEEHKTMPPVLFSELVQSTVDEEVIRQKIDALIALKRQSKGNDNKEVDADLVDYARRLAEHFEHTIPDFRPEINHDGSSSDLDALLKEMILRK
ncbi:MAG: nucleotidyltransferase domain-containing protein [Bacteroidales bacterium]|nr:nucleotidyltransferase domain-containing protein [Bacteroidales bacterium]